MTKRLINLLPVFAIAVVIAVACSTKEEGEKYGEISGIVFDNKVGEPVPIAQVKLSPRGSSNITGSDGSFSFTNITPGNYTITANKRGYDEGSNIVTVVSGKKSECNILMNRIPAYVTADKKILDFGDNITLTTLSFNIVNSSYENLSWHIEYDTLSSFIAKVTPDKGTTQYGKTAAIVVKIDRERLNTGLNESTIVIVSDNGDGSSEVRVKAVGQEKAKPSLYLEEVTDITSSTAIVHGEISFVGTPKYTERGFVYNITENPDIDVKIEKVTASVNSDSLFSYMIKGLTLGVKYYVRAYAINEEGVAYSNQVSFTTVASLPRVSIILPDHLDATYKTATLRGSVEYLGDPQYSEKGFVYCIGRNTPTISDSIVQVSGSGLGPYSASIKGLKLGGTYSVRSYAMNEGGYYYSETVEFTMTGTKPKVSVGETDIDFTELNAVLHGNLEFIGSPIATEKGFVYSYVNKTPTLYDSIVVIDGIREGSYSATIKNLVLNKTYNVRAYAVNEVGVAYSEVETFSTVPIPPKVSMGGVNTNSETQSAVFYGVITNDGVPSYTERGFVYSSIYENPTINDQKILADDSSTDAFEKEVNNLSFNTTYHVRAYAINIGGVAYSENHYDFSLYSSNPEVKTLASSNINRGNGNVTLNGSITKVGVPTYHEKGFVYSRNSQPTIADSKIVVKGGGTGDFSITTTLPRSGTTYVRAYATNGANTVYGEAIKALGPEYVKVSGMYVALDDQGLFDKSTAMSACNGLVIEGMSGWRVPSLSELKTLYANRDKIGGFTYGSYWSTDYETVTNKFSGIQWKVWSMIRFSDGVQTQYDEHNSGGTYVYRVRCIR